MRLLRVRTDAGRTDAVLDEEDRVRLLGPSTDPVDLDRWRARAAEALAAPGTEDQPRLADVDLDPPIRPGKIVCVGLNYADHAAEGGQTPPAEPILFLKAADTVTGPNDPVRIPPGSTSTDWEVELGVVIGRPTWQLESAAAASAAVAGYVIVNDLSEREWQLGRGGQWDKGKNFPGFCPIGPWLLTADAVPNPQGIRLGLDVDGRRCQDSSTAKMIFPVLDLVHYVSRCMALYPGDVIATGTPAGVGAGQRPPRYLAAGAEVRAWADGLGEQRTRFVDDPGPFDQPNS